MQKLFVRIWCDLPTIHTNTKFMILNEGEVLEILYHEDEIVAFCIPKRNNDRFKYKMSESIILKYILNKSLIII